MSVSTGSPRARFSFPYHTCRNISGPEDKAAERKVLVGHAPASSFLDLKDNENVREYLVDLPGKRKRSPTLVHQAIRDTLANRPDQFCILNGGICIVATEAVVDDNKRVMRLREPSIINGSQTQGELRRYFKSYENAQPEIDPSVTFELIVCDDEDTVAEISIARNFQNDVRAISIAGRRGQLDELEKAVCASFPGLKLRKSESELSDDYLETEKLIQVLFALSPESIWDKFDENVRITSKTVSYSQKTRCLKTFQRVVENKNEEPYAELYQFFLDMAGSAWSLYTTWKEHPGFKGTRIQAIKRASDGSILEVPDGIVFPLLASLSAFVRRESGRWQLRQPKQCDDKMLIDAALDEYKEIANHNPQTMGKSKACYTGLLRLTKVYAEMSDRT